LGRANVRRLLVMMVMMIGVTIITIPSVGRSIMSVGRGAVAKSVMMYGRCMMMPPGWYRYSTGGFTVMTVSMGAPL
jgi:hypothetical protein